MENAFVTVGKRFRLHLLVNACSSQTSSPSVSSVKSVVSTALSRMNKKTLGERDIRTKIITPDLVAAGWNVDTQVREEVGFTSIPVSPSIR